MKTIARMIGTIALTLALAAGMAPQAEAGKYQMPITFGGYTNRMEALTNFPVLVVFSNGIGQSGFSFSNYPFATTNGYDLRFYTNSADTGSGLDYEIESWDTNSASYVWVRVPLIPTNGSGSIYARWNDGAASSQLPCTTNGAVWDASYAGVWHMNQSNAVDSTTNAHLGTANANTNVSGGFIGAAQGFNSSSSSFISFNNTGWGAIENVGLTVEAWSKSTTMDGFIGRGNAGSDNTYDWGIERTRFYSRKGGNLTGFTIPTDGNWHHVACTYNGSQQTVYIDATQVATLTGLAGNALGACTNAPRIGYDSVTSDQAHYYSGLMDEVRFSGIARSSNWVWACYANTASNAFFNGYGTVESLGASIALQPVADVTTNSVKLIATLVGTSADLYAFWDTQDRGTNFTWAYTNSPLGAFANTAAGATITNSVSGLASGVQYFYRFYGTNTTSGWSGWSDAGSFTTPGPPIVDNAAGQSGVGTNSVTLNGRVTATNGATTYGMIFWGPTDGSNNAAAWANTNTISGTVTQGVAFSVALTNLTGEQYYYRTAASNSYGLSWATNSVGFLLVVPQALGGDTISDIAGGYRVHTYTNIGTSTFQVVRSGTVELLVVGGGGAGGLYGGGGGAGGLITNYAFTVVGASNYMVVVGGGGGGGSGRGTNGQDSVFGSLRAYGGGGGGARDTGVAYQHGLSGGSGGGASPLDGGTYPTAGVAIVVGQGNSGGLGGQPGHGAGGGGGAGQVGSNAVTNVGGKGGDGLLIGISGSNVWYAGGGGGGCYSDGSPGAGGQGGGGAGGPNGTSGYNATNSTGGGGGGSGYSATKGGNGGSGIVIVRYLLNTGPWFAMQSVANQKTNSADLSATLHGGSGDVYVYWDTQDRGTNFTWAYTNAPLNAFANTAAGVTITNTASGLAAGTPYAYRFYVSNTVSGASGWSDAGSFTTPGAPLVDNTNGVSGIGVGTATLNGRVTSTNGAVCYGKIFWGPTDGSNNPAAWAYTNDIAGTVAQGVPYSVTLSNLLYGQQYHYRAAASNNFGLGWATNSVGFMTAAPGVGITNTVASGGTSTSAVLNATLQGTGSVFTVSAYYWAAGAPSSNVVAVGTYTNAASTNLGVTVSDLAPGANYAYTFMAGNPATNLWASPAVPFITGALTAQTNDGSCGLSSADTATIIINRPATCANEALTVNYALGGASAYVTASPASGFTMAAGESNRTVTLTPSAANMGAETNVVLTLLPGAYALGEPGSATCTVKQITATALTLATNAYVSGNGQLISDAGAAVLLTATGGAGTPADPYIFDLGGSLNMAGFTIRGCTNNSQNQYSATWRVWGNVTGNGKFDSYTDQNSIYGGDVTIEAGGGIAVGRVYTRVTHNAVAGAVYLWAKGGSVTVTNCIDTQIPSGYGTKASGAVTIRSEGPVAGQGIAIQGYANGNGTTNISILTENVDEGGFGNVGLYCQTNITLAGGISTRGYFSDSGDVTIRGSFADAAARAGAVSIGGPTGIRADGTWLGNSPGPRGGNVTVKAASLYVGGNVDARVWGHPNNKGSGNVDIDVLENASVAGIVDTRLVSDGQGSPGYVKIVGRRIAVLGTDASGFSIRTFEPGLTITSGGSVAGDADVTLTGVDTSSEIYDPSNPTNSMTSSIVVAGKIGTGRWGHDNAMGNVRLTAVEVQLGGDVTNYLSTAGSVMAMRYGITNYSVITHLVENGIRWPGGTNPHIITYTLTNGTPSFTGDVPYAGKLGVSVSAQIENRPVTNVTQTSATFRGYLQENGDPAAAVSVRWGETAGNLDHTNGWAAGAWGDGSYPATNITPLTADRNYYYAFVGENAGGTMVATPAEYLITGVLTPSSAPDPTCGGSMTDTTTISISRPGTCVAGPLTVNYALSGTTEYVTVSPASGFTLPAGQQSTNIVFTPVKPNLGAPVSVTLTLRPGAYPSDALAADSITVATAVGYSLTANSDTSIGTAMDVVETPPDTVTVAVAGSTYTYDFWTSSLNLNGKRISYAGNRTVVLTNLAALTDSGTGRIDASTTAGAASGGGVTVHAPGGIALNGANAGGQAVDSSSISGNSYYGGDVTLIATGGVALTAGGIRSQGLRGGQIWITDGSGGSAGNVSVAGDLNAYSSGDSRNNDGSVQVRGNTVAIASNVVTAAAGSYGSAKPVTLIASGALTVGGYLAAYQSYTPYPGSGGAVTLTGATVTVSGTTNGISIATWMATNYSSNVAGDIRATATAGDLTIAGGLDAWHPATNSRGNIVLSAPNGRITMGSLDAARFKTLALSVGATYAVRVTGVLTNFPVNESPKTITFPTNSVIGSDIYYDAKYNQAIPLSGEYKIFVATTDTGKMLRERWTGAVYQMR